MTLAETPIQSGAVGRLSRRLTLTYVYHDCFVLESAEAMIVFDYWRSGSRGADADGLPWFLERLRGGAKRLYVVVSHHHKDHFVKGIFSWREKLPDVPTHYILSRDTERSVRYMLRPGSTYPGRVDPEQYTVLGPGDVFDDGRVRVRAFGSTDIGNSYLVEIGGRVVFHAGDLNAWMWKDESTAAEVQEAISAYEAVLEDVAAAAPELDLAMFPVDSRIGRDYWEGARRFVRRIDVRRFVPMHFELADDAAELEQRHRDAVDFAAYAHPDRGDYIGLLCSGDLVSF